MFRSWQQTRCMMLSVDSSGLPTLQHQLFQLVPDIQWINFAPLHARRNKLLTPCNIEVFGTDIQWINLVLSAVRRNKLLTSCNIEVFGTDIQWTNFALLHP